MYDLDLAILKKTAEKQSCTATELLNAIRGKRRKPKYDLITISYSVQSLCRDGLLHANSEKPIGFDTICITEEGVRAVLAETDKRVKERRLFILNYVMTFAVGFLSGFLIALVTRLL